MTAADNRTALTEIKKQMLTGQLSYAEAQAKAQPIIDNINRGNATIAKKHGRRAAKLSFSYLMRQS